MTPLHSTRAYVLPNNSAQIIGPQTEPWLNTVPLPSFPSKDAYREYCKHPQTDYLFFNFSEGEVSTLRVGAGNKVHRLHGIVADYDCAGLTAEEVNKGLKRIPDSFPPFAWNRTFSGGVRVCWLFETPVFYYSEDVCKKFIGRVVKELKLKAVFAGLDDAIFNPAMYYTAGDKWTVNTAAIIPTARLELWTLDACKIHHDKGSIEVPLELVTAEAQKRFPDRVRGDFADGARMNRFWEAGADALSVIIRPGGAICFTGNESFVAWDRIFGRDFVQSYLADRRGKAIKDLYSDGETYFRRLLNGAWDSMGVDATKRHLKCEFGLSDKAVKGEDASEIDLVLNHLETKKRVESALPFPLTPNDVVDWNGKTYLNASTARLWPAATEPQEWGENFPWMAEYLQTLFMDDENLLACLSWLHVWIKSAHAGRPCRGQSMFIVGPPNTGKSLLSRQIIARMVGGYADGRDHLVDGGRFNSSMFEKALWTIDDSTALSSQKAHARFSSLVKAVVANDSFQYEEKYGYSGSVPFVGRLVVTLNDDPVSLGILPDTDQSLIDKAFMLRTGSTPAKVAPTEKERYETIERELGFFVRFLIDFKFPDWLERDDRFGVKAWHDRAILNEARAGASSTMIIDLIDSWRVEWAKSNKVPWEGAVATLYQTLHVWMPSVIGKMTPMVMGKMITQAMSNGDCAWMHRIRMKDSARSRGLKIEMPPTSKTLKGETKL